MLDSYRGNIKGGERNRFVDSIPPHTRNAPPTCASRFDCVGCGQGRAVYATCRARWNFLGSKRADATNNDVMQIRFVFFFLFLFLSLWIELIHDSPREKKRIFFGRTGPKYGRPFEGRETWRRTLLIFLERKERFYIDDIKVWRILDWNDVNCCR